MDRLGGLVHPAQVGGDRRVGAGFVDVGSPASPVQRGGTFGGVVLVVGAEHWGCCRERATGPPVATVEAGEVGSAPLMAGMVLVAEAFASDREVLAAAQLDGYLGGVDRLGGPMVNAAEPVGGDRRAAASVAGPGVGSAPLTDSTAEDGEGEALGSVGAVLAGGSAGEVRLDGRVVGGVLPAGRVEGVRLVLVGPSAVPVNPQDRLHDVLGGDVCDLAFTRHQVGEDDRGGDGEGVAVPGGAEGAVAAQRPQRSQQRGVPVEGALSGTTEGEVAGEVVLFDLLLGGGEAGAGGDELAGEPLGLVGGRRADQLEPAAASGTFGTAARHRTASAASSGVGSGCPAAVCRPAIAPTARSRSDSDRSPSR